jgi:hypothetical protein
MLFIHSMTWKKLSDTSREEKKQIEAEFRKKA